MEALPAEVLRLIVGYLHRSSYWPFARTCPILYGVIRPSLFRVTSLKLELQDGRLNMQQFGSCMETLGDANNKKAAGQHIKTLIVLFKEAESSDTESVEGTRVMEALGTLLHSTPSVRELIINGMPDCTPPSDGDTEYTTCVELFKQGLGQLSDLHSLECAAADEETSHAWPEAMLSSLPDTLQQLCLLPDFEPDGSAQAPESSLTTQFTAPITDLYYSCPEPGSASENLLSSILDNSPRLVKLCIAQQCLTIPAVTALFGSKRQYEHLTLNTVDIPRVPDSRQSLSHQSKLTYLDARCGSDFLYYLAFLPPSLEHLALSLSVRDQHTYTTEQTLEEVFSQVRYCLTDSSWCPSLAHLHIDLHTEATEEDYDFLVESAVEMRVGLQALLGSRETIPTTNSDFWTFKPDLGDTEDGWEAGLKEIKKRADTKI